MVSGHADTQPRVANDTAANRASNRRVDITFANGRDRPGVWASAAPAAPTLSARLLTRCPFSLARRHVATAFFGAAG